MASCCFRSCSYLNIGFSHFFYCATANHQIKESFKALNRDCACSITTMLPEQILFPHCTEWRNGFCVIEMRNHKMAAIQFTSQIPRLPYCTQTDNLLWCFNFGWRHWSSCENFVYLIFRLADLHRTKKKCTFRGTWGKLITVLYCVFWWNDYTAKQLLLNMPETHF